MNDCKYMSHTRPTRRLEDLNLMDDFLFQEILSQEETGEEFARILLRTILGKNIRRVKVVPQKNILGIDTDKHGIRLDAYIEDISNEPGMELADVSVSADIYDLEPNNKYEKRTLPKRMRYYHGLIDTQLLATGIEYEKLQNVVIIVILPYDPFDRKRMIYTVQNQCVEDSSVTYEDGAKKIFLYTKGTTDNSSQELVDMLKYLEETTEDNITNQDIASIHRLVDKIKGKKEVGINYMKSWEREAMIRKDGIADGKEEMQERMNQLTIKLADAGRTDDIIKAARDVAYQEELFEEFDL